MLSKHNTLKVAIYKCMENINKHIPPFQYNIQKMVEDLTKKTYVIIRTNKHKLFWKAIIFKVVASILLKNVWFCGAGLSCCDSLQACYFVPSSHPTS